MSLAAYTTVAWLGVAAVVAYLLAGPAARRTGAERHVLEDLLSTVIFWALMGSRLIYAIVDPVATLQQPMRLLLLKGIVSVWGAAAGALAALVYLAWRRRVRTGDVGGAILLLGPFTGLQVVGMAVLGLGVLAGQSNQAEP